MKAVSKAQENSWSTFLYKGVVIDPDCKVTYGNNVKIMPLVSIGEVGFGFEHNAAGYLMPLTRRYHPFGVIIQDNVEIGSNTVIHRGRWRDTVIGRGSKIDSLVLIAHNVIVGKNVLVVAHTTLCGSCEIGDECFIGAGAEIKPGVKIAHNVTIGMGAVVLNDITQPNSTWVGNPAKKIRDTQVF